MKFLIDIISVQTNSLTCDVDSGSLVELHRSLEKARKQDPDIIIKLSEIEQ